VLWKFVLVSSIAVGLLAADRSFISYAAASRAPLPAALRNAGESTWLAWCRREDKSIRARLRQGDLDSMVNLLLYGTSFTRQPRISMEGEGLTVASRVGVLHARVDDMVAGLRGPGRNERLVFLQHVLREQGIDPQGSGAATGKFILENLLRVAKERKALAERAAAEAPSSPLDRSSLFENRGLSLDTGIIPDFSIEQTLRDLKAHGILREGQVARVAVVGPGLDFIDKNEASAYDYYPEQTLQPFALYDSLVRLHLAKPGALSISILDISSRVIEHIQRAREHARKGIGYEIQLPHDSARPWPQALTGYWKSLGDHAGAAVAPIPPPPVFPGLQTRAVRIRPAVVLACQPADLDIVLERLNLKPSEQFDLIVGTNIFVYYDPFEQALALENAGAMLKPGGLLLTNDRLPVTSAGSIALAGVTEVPFDAPGVHVRQAVGWYRKQ
jgi:SAM-dependent methyltransferase